MNKPNFASRLKELRFEADLSLAQLSLILKMTPSALGNYENDRRQPSFDTLIKVSDYFNVSTDYLLGRSDFKNPYEVTKYEDTLSDATTLKNKKAIQDFLEIISNIEILDTEDNLKTEYLEEIIYLVKVLQNELTHFVVAKGIINFEVPDISDIKSLVDFMNESQDRKSECQTLLSGIFDFTLFE